MNDLENFLYQQSHVINKICTCLLKYRIHKDEKDKDKIICFFKNIKEKSRKLNLIELYLISSTYELFLENIQKYDDFFFSKILKGMALLSEEIEYIMKSKFNDSSKFNLCKNKYCGNILFINNSKFEVENILNELINRKHNVHCLKDSLSIESLIKYNKFDLIILENTNLNELSINIFKDIKKLDDKIPVIFLTNKNYCNEDIEALRLGFEEYLLKSSKIEEHIARIEKVLNKSIEYKKVVQQDNLTGAFNKECFIKKIDELKKNDNVNYCFCFIDLDEFKDINDKHGHLAGDDTLKIFVKVLKKMLNKNDEIYRFGGDEFVVIFNNTNLKDSYRKIEEIRKYLDDREYNIQNVSIQIKFSAGIAMKDASESPLDVLDRADHALYDSKKSGRSKTSKYKCLDKKDILFN